MRFFWLLFCYSFIFFSTAIISFIFLPGNGELVGIVLFFCILSIALLLGDRFILHLLKSTKCKDLSPVVQTIKNLSLTKSLPSVEVYLSSASPTHIFLVEGPIGRPYIILGEHFSSHLNNEELEILLTFALRKIQNRDSLTNCLFIFAIVLPIFPILMLPETKAKHFIASVVLNLLRPFFFLHKKFSRRFDYRQENLTQDDGHHFLPSIWPKFRPLSTKENGSYIQQSLMGFLAIVEREDKFLTESLLDGL